MLPPAGEFDAIRRIQAETQALIDQVRESLAEMKQRDGERRARPWACETDLGSDQQQQLPTREPGAHGPVCSDRS